MHRLELADETVPGTMASPEMTVTEAAEEMERFHVRQMLVARDRTPVGVVSEEDIVTKVLAPGLDPSRIHVSDIMASGRLDGTGSLLVEDETDQAAPLWGSEPIRARDEDDDRVLLEVLSGECEECGVFHEELVDYEGLLMCPDCTGFRSALFS